MNRKCLILFAMLAATAGAAVLSDAERGFLAGRRIATSRDTQSVPGSVITTWSRNGKVEAVVTNVIKRVDGVVQNNPLQARIAELTTQYQSAIARATSAEARAARMDALKTWLIEQRDKAALPTTKALYQAIIDKLEDN